MDEYKIELKLLTETMPGSGMSVPGIIDNDVRFDEYGLPYMNAKTFKGHIREQMEFLKKFSKAYENIDINALLGSDDRESEKVPAKLKFSEVGLSDGIRECIGEAVRKKKLERTEVLNAITVVYTRTMIGADGVAKAHSLRKEREFRRNLILETKIFADDLNEEEKSFLYDAVRALKHIGMHKSKGKGVVSCTIKSDKGDRQ